MQLSDTESVLVKLSVLSVGVLAGLVITFINIPFLTNSVANKVEFLIYVIVFFLLLFTTLARNEDGEVLIDANKHRDVKNKALVSFSISILISGCIHYFEVSYYHAAAVAGVICFTTLSDVYDDEPAYWRFIWMTLLIAIYLMLSWINHSAIQRLSDISFYLDDALLITYFPIMVSLGFGATVALLLPVKGVNKVAVLILFSSVFVYGQTLTINAWSSYLDDSLPNKAMAAYLSNASMMEASKINEERPQGRDRVEAPFWAPTTVLDNRAFHYIEQINNSSIIKREVAKVKRKLFSPSGYQDIGYHFPAIKNEYVHYLKTYLLGVHGERAATYIAERSAPALITSQSPLSYREIIRAIWHEIEQELKIAGANERRKLAILNHERGRAKVELIANSYGISLREGWEFSSNAQFRALLQEQAISISSTANHLPTSKKGVSFADIASVELDGRPFVTWQAYTKHLYGVHLPLIKSLDAQYDERAYAEDLSALFAMNQPIDIIQAIYLFKTSEETYPVKAVFLPPLTIVSSFLFLLAGCALALIYAVTRPIKKLRQSIGLQAGVRGVGLAVILTALFLITKSRGYEAYLIAQDKLHSFTSLLFN